MVHFMRYNLSKKDSCISIASDSTIWLVDINTFALDIELKKVKSLHRVGRGWGNDWQYLHCMLYNFTLKNRLNNSYVNFCQLDVCIEYFRYILVF